MVARGGVERRFAVEMDGAISSLSCSGFESARLARAG